MEEAEHEMKIIAKVYRAPDGGKPAYKTWQDVKEISPGITLNTVMVWFKLNVQPKGQVWGERNSYVAPHAFFEYQVDLFFCDEKAIPKPKI